MRRLLYLAALSVVATLAFASVAMAEYLTAGQSQDESNGKCSGAAEKMDESVSGHSLLFVPDVGGCIDGEVALGFGTPPLYTLNSVAIDPNTGEILGEVKDLDPSLTSGANRTNYKELCGAFGTEAFTAQEYYDQTSILAKANAKERAILDPDGDGQACTDEDAASISGANGGQPGGSSKTGDGGAADQQYDGAPGGGGAGGPSGPGSGGQPGGGQVQGLPDTGGPALLLPVAGLLLGSGILGLFVAIRRRA